MRADVVAGAETSVRIQEILEVLRDIKDGKPQTVYDIAPLRVKATGAAAKRRNITYRTVQDSYRRQLGLKDSPEFDSLVGSWLLQGNQELRKTVEAHVGLERQYAD